MDGARAGWPGHHKAALVLGVLSGTALVTGGIFIGLDGKVAAGGACPYPNDPQRMGPCVYDLRPNSIASFSVAGAALVGMGVSLAWPRLRGRR